MMEERDDLRKQDPASPRLSTMNDEITKATSDHKRRQWREFVESIDHRTDSTKLWRTIKGIDGKSKQTAENEGITFTGRDPTPPDSQARQGLITRHLIQTHLAAMPICQASRGAHLTLYQRISLQLKINTASDPDTRQHLPSSSSQRTSRQAVCVAIDLTADFDTVSHDTLISKIVGLSLPLAITRWLSCYLRGRQAATSFRGTKSSTRIVRTGVLQGSKLLPSLFNYYIADMPRPTPPVKRVCYADDITVWATGPKIPQLESMINNYLRDVSIYLKDNSLLISAPK